ncbi:MAG TPA: TonB-dependent receptor, partial [Vicinamibacterales bacterium]|nr:TonB-dependent receptor [Vicinamibacterales bacterium]
AVVGPVGPYAAWSNNVVFPKYGVRYDSRFVSSDFRTTYATYADPITGYSVEKRNGVEQWGLSGSADYKINDKLSSKFILTYNNFTSHLAHDSDGSPLGLQTVNGIGSFSGGTAELRFNGVALAEDRLEWTAGLFYYDSKSGNAQVVSIPALNPVGLGIIGRSNHKVDNQNESVYLHSVYKATDKLGFTAGLRYSKDDRTFHFDDTASSVGQRDMDASGSNVDYKVGADYKFTSDIMAYASVSTGYKPKAFNPRPFQASQLVPVDGEELLAYELGLKSDLLDNRLRTNVAAFYSDYKKRILSRPGVECLKTPAGVVIPVPSSTAGSVVDPQGSGVFCLTTSLTNYVNIPGKIKGLELELEARPIEDLSITAGGGYTDFTAANLGSGAMPVYVPKYNANVGLAYTVHTGGGGKIVPRAEYYYQSQICYTLSAATATNPAASCADGYFQVNARVEFTTGNGDWTVGAGVTNLTKEDYYYNIFDLSAFGQPTIEGTPSRPREWFLSITRQFK